MKEEKKDGLLIYVKNDAQRDELKKKFPDMRAEFINSKGDAEGNPMVCITKDGRERCEIGEEFIELFSKELEGNE